MYDKKPVPPALDDMQRKQAWDLALAQKQAQVGLRASIEEGTVRLDEAMTYEWAGGMKVRWLLQSLPFVKSKHIEPLLAAASIPFDSTVRRLGHKQKLALLREVGKLEAQRAHSQHQKLLAAEKKADRNASAYKKV